MYIDWRKQQAEGKRIAPCQGKFLHLAHCHQGGSEPGLNGIDNLYIPTSSLAICFSVFADTCLDTERRACPQPAAFFSWCTRIAPSTYVYWLFTITTILPVLIKIMTWFALPWCHLLYYLLARSLSLCFTSNYIPQTIFFYSINKNLSAHICCTEDFGYVTTTKLWNEP